MQILTDTTEYFRLRNRFQNEFEQASTAHVLLPWKFDTFLWINGAHINRDSRDSKKLYGVDALGIVPGVDVIEFVSEELYAWFVLKWL